MPRRTTASQGAEAGFSGKAQSTGALFSHGEVQALDEFPVGSVVCSYCQKTVNKRNVALEHREHRAALIQGRIQLVADSNGKFGFQA